MNVRIEWEPGGSTPPPRRTGQGPDQKPPRKLKRKDIMLFGAMGVGVVALAAALIISPGSKRDGAENKAPNSSASPSGSPAATDAPGLPRGTATAAGKLSTRAVGAVPRGFPQSQDGAVEAASTMAAASLDMFRLPKDGRDALQKDWYAASPPADFEDNGRTWRAQNHLDDTGRLIDAGSGTPATGQRFTSQCHPELGAYKVENYTGTAAAVTVWYPCVSGVLDPATATDLTGQWMLGQFTLSWTRGDWRLTMTGAGPYSSVPAPADEGQPVVTYAERARLLTGFGGGWRLYADASETAPAEVREARK